MKIAVAGTGYVGLSNSILLAQHNEVVAVDVIQEKVDLINHKKSPIVDTEIEDYLANKELNLKATTDGNSAYKDAEIVIISTPTNYDEVKDHFDTSSVESVIEQVLECNKDAVMVIKSTIPVGYTEGIRKNIIQRILFFHRNFYVKAEHCMIICIRPVLLLVFQKKMTGSLLWRINLQNFCRKVL